MGSFCKGFGTRTGGHLRPWQVWNISLKVSDPGSDQIFVPMEQSVTIIDQCSRRFAFKAICHFGLPPIAAEDTSNDMFQGLVNEPDDIHHNCASHWSRM